MVKRLWDFYFSLVIYCTLCKRSEIFSLASEPEISPREYMKKPAMHLKIQVHIKSQEDFIILRNKKRIIDWWLLLALMMMILNKEQVACEIATVVTHVGTIHLFLSMNHRRFHFDTWIIIIIFLFRKLRKNSQDVQWIVHHATSS